MKTYRRHACDRAHRSQITFARCTFRYAHWVTGYIHGAYASVSRCRGTTVILWDTPEQAANAKTTIDATGCGGACVRRHEVIHLEVPARTVVTTGRAA